MRPGSTARYPAGTVRALLEGPHVSAATRAVLEARLAARTTPAPRFFDIATFATLSAVCERLVPESIGRVSVAAMIDTRLADGMTDGWRYDAMPPDGDAYRLGLLGVDEHAHQRFGAAFVSLGDAPQDAVLREIQRTDVRGGVWDRVPAARFFEELLAEAVECFFSHPLAQEAIGYAGMADVPSWTSIGLDRLDAREPRAVRRTRE